MVDYHKINELLVKYPDFSDSKLAKIYSIDTDLWSSEMGIDETEYT